MFVSMELVKVIHIFGLRVEVNSNTASTMKQDNAYKTSAPFIETKDTEH